MTVLAAFSPPAGLDDTHRGDWNKRVRAIFKPFAARFSQFYDPTAEDTPATARPATIAWTAFPASLLRTATSQEGRWQRADMSPRRVAQDEYCEWSVERKPDGKLTSVTFTTELPEYWEHLAATDRDALVDLYRRLVSPDVKAAHLFALSLRA